MNALRFDGRVAIVTGAGRGLGREHALALGARGAQVLVNDIGGAPDMTGADPAPAAAVAAEIEAGGGVAAANFDSVATTSGARAIAADALARWGRVDILVNNAGGGIGAHSIDELPEDDLRRMVDTHLLGAFFTIGAVWSQMLDQRYGRILNTSSAAAFGLPGSQAYSSVKAGLLGLTRSLALDGAAHDVKVNAIMPLAYTRLSAGVPGDVGAWIERTLRASQVAAVATALVHEDVPFTGETLSVGGGRAARVFFGGVPGWQDADLTPELVLQHADEIMDTSEPVVIFDGNDDLRFLDIPGPGEAAGS
jgi:NAD(P)-dependent dehydrogenase (short-subunit alcohol dehydrogenase family)